VKPTQFVPVPDPYLGHILHFQTKFVQDLAFLMFKAELLAQKIVISFFTRAFFLLSSFHFMSDPDPKRSGSAKAKRPGF
jgi:hypothetical protein